MSIRLLVRFCTSMNSARPVPGRIVHDFADDDLFGRHECSRNAPGSGKAKNTSHESGDWGMGNHLRGTEMLLGGCLSVPNPARRRQGKSLANRNTGILTLELAIPPARPKASAGIGWNRVDRRD